jgi:hypothetical protein
MLGLVGLVFMLVMTFMYWNELGWQFLLGAWAIILLSPMLQFVGVSVWIVVMIQIAVVAGVYAKAKSG